MRGLLALLTIVYPFAIWLGIGHFEPRLLALLIVLLVALRWKYVASLWGARWAWLFTAGALAIVLIVVGSNQLLPLKLYPVLVNLIFLTVFAQSLHKPPTVVERIARITEPDLPPSGVAYTRQVTKVWCLFFVVNGSIALSTALWASEQTWALYNGLIAYLLMGALFAGEYLVRRQVRKHHG